MGLLTIQTVKKLNFTNPRWRINYARWIRVHWKDMAELPERHQEVARKFREGSFTVQKTIKIFSSIPIEQAHKHNISKETVGSWPHY